MASGVRSIVLLALVLVVGCAPAESTSIDPAQAAPGPHSEGSDVFIVYPDPPPILMESAVGFTKRWFAETSDLGFPAFGGGATDGVLSSSRVDDELRVWVELAAAGLMQPIGVAQMTIENRATDAEDALYVEKLIPAFLAAAGVEPVPAELGLDTVEGLFDEARTATLVADGVTIYLAMNKWSLVLGVTGG